jgi:CDP-diacylglycerol--glycerol-3-phosphate 3-phosphatidyltransferase
MLDTHGRKYVDKYINSTSNFLLTLKLTPIKVTFIALVLGLCASIAYYFDFKFLSIIILWISGYLDAVDGAMARKSNTVTKTGTLLDIFFDRVVELAFIVIFALKHDNAVFALLCLTCAIVMSMSVFLTSGMLIENKGKKGFHYQAGLMERTEGFIMFTLMIIFNKYMMQMTFLYAALIAFTVFQRLRETIKILEERNE